MTSADDARPAAGPVDLDLIADYLAGVLDTPAARRVEAMADADPVWAASLRALRRADADVLNALAGPDAATGPMPDDVFERIMAALPVGEAPASTGPHAVPSVGGMRGWNALRGGADRPAGGRPPTRSGATAPLDRDDRRVSRRPARRPTHRLPIAGAAVLILAFVAILGGVITLVSNNSNKSTTASNEAAPPGAVDTNRNPAGPQLNGNESGSVDGVTVIASGTDYTFATLGGFRALGSGGGGTAPVPAATGKNSDFGAPTVPGLGRLSDPTQLEICLSAVVAQFGTRPDTVDFARYQGSPALILDLPAIKQVLAVGPDCGAPGAGIDEKGQAPLR